MKKHIITTLCTLACAMLAPAQVPSLINYQGRLTDSNGAPVTGSKNFSLSIFDAEVSGNLLYAENLGNVVLDDNGIYAFSFGSAGTRDVQVIENIETTNESTSIYNKTLSNSPVVPGSASVTDGVFSWNEVTGNPGIQAAATASVVSGFVVGATITNAGDAYTSPPLVTISGNGSGATAEATVSGGTVTEITITSAGSGYTTGATITIAPPPSPFIVDYTGSTVTVSYDPAPPAGRPLAITYTYVANGLQDALGSTPEHWLQLSIDGVTQSPRQRILAVPFALASARDAEFDVRIENAFSSMERILALSHTTNTRTIDGGNLDEIVNGQISSGNGTIDLDGEYVRTTTIHANDWGSNLNVTFHYLDNTTSTVSLSIGSAHYTRTFSNPDVGKRVNIIRAEGFPNVQTMNAVVLRQAQRTVSFDGIDSSGRCAFKMSNGGLINGYSAALEVYSSQGDLLKTIPHQDFREFFTIPKDTPLGNVVITFNPDQTPISTTRPAPGSVQLVNVNLRE